MVYSSGRARKMATVKTDHTTREKLINGEVKVMFIKGDSKLVDDLRLRLLGGDETDRIIPKRKPARPDTLEIDLVRVPKDQIDTLVNIVDNDYPSLEISLAE